MRTRYSDDMISWLYSFTLRGVKLDLENTKELLRRLGDPHLSMKHIHVGGTDGKGSISACISSILISSGIRTGLYTSPHLTMFNERITVDGKMITDKDLGEILQRVRESVEVMEIEGKAPTFFEISTVAAFLYFKEKNVEYAVVEVGMGGRLDSTNVITPEVCVIGNISIEHIEFLGDNIERIAYEKAGIIKSGVPCVTKNDETAFKVLKEIAEEKGAHLTRVSPDDIELERVDPERTVFRYKGERHSVSIPGGRQADNAVLAVETVSKLKIYDQYIRCNIKKGLEEVRWPCRMEKISGLPLILDVTHTVAGSEALAHDIYRLYGKVDIVLGMLKDKNAEKVAENLSKIARKIMISGLKTDRSAGPQDLKKIFSRGSSDVKIYDSISDAMDEWMATREDGDDLLITGSFHTAEESIEWLRRTYPGYWTYSQRNMTVEHTRDGHRKV